MTSPLRAIRLKCLDCCLGSPSEVRACTAGKHCSFHALRNGRRAGAEGIRPLRIIRDYCRACGEGSYADVVNCPMNDCPLYPFRLGKNPNREGRILDDEQKAILRERLASARAAKMPGLPDPLHITSPFFDSMGLRVDSYPKVEATP